MTPTIAPVSDCLWRELVLNKAPDTALADRIVQAIDMLFEQDANLFARRVHERTMTALLACHMRSYFEDWDVDCEFNRDIGHVADRKLHGETAVMPDVIVHKRRTQQNFLAIEVKQGVQKRVTKGELRDIQKLAGYLDTDNQGYNFALFLKFKIGTQAPGLWRCEWLAKAKA